MECTYRGTASFLTSTGCTVLRKHGQGGNTHSEWTQTLEEGRPLVSSDLFLPWGFPGGAVVKNLPAIQKTRVQSLGWKDPLEEGMATPSSILAWRIPMDRGA